MSNHILVDVKDRAYPIFIQTDNCINKELFNYIKTDHLLIVTNTTIAELFLPKWEKIFRDNGYTVQSCIIPDGEQYKNWQTLQLIFDKLLENSYSRDSSLVALGGGVVGDMTGFAASAYQRGINFIQIPTTLLAQVDSSVGGKTAINHPLGKNMIGAFYQPDVVYIETETLKTLPQREFSSGLAEVIKYGCLDDYDFFCYLEENINQIMSLESVSLKQAIQRCCEIKAQIVAEDETERTGRRALLNFGHTFGHAIEAKQQYKGLQHGEAVAVGMLIATKLSVQLSLISDSFFIRLHALIAAAKLPVNIPGNISVDDFIYYMRKDKKNSHGKIKLILLDNPGQARLRNDIDEADIRSCLESFV